MKVNNKYMLIYLGKRINLKISPKSNFIYDESTVPYISNYYYEAKIYSNKNFKLPLYITDYYQREYMYDDDSMKFSLRIELDDNEPIYLNNIKAGDYELDLGIVSIGAHWVNIQVIDTINNLKSQQLYKEFLVVDVNSYDIKPSEVYTITENDLTNYGITLGLTSDDDETLMKNNRVGLSKLFRDLQTQGYRKCILINGIYRVNRALRRGSIENETCCIIIPTNFTVDMNGSTFKLQEYNDTDYGEFARVENLIVNIYKAEDSHLINGIIEGDYFERGDKGWIAGGNGEPNNGVGFYGGKYSTIENVTIKQITGYNLVATFDPCVFSAPINTFKDGIKLINGIETYNDKYCTTEYFDLTNYLSYETFQLGVYLGYNSVPKGDIWFLDISLYDENKNFIKEIRINQHRDFPIKSNVKYIRISALSLAERINGINIHHLGLPKNCSAKNIEMIDLRTCAAPALSRDFLLENVNFTRCGVSITPCPIDLEDGWNNCQDFHIKNVHILEEAASSTAGLIIRGGLNIDIDNFTGGSIIKDFYANDACIKNCDGIYIEYYNGFGGSNAGRIYNNTNMSIKLGSQSPNVTTKIKAKNNTMKGLGYVQYPEKNKISNSVIILPTTNSIYWHNYSSLEKCDIYMTGSDTVTHSLKGNMYFNKCKFYKQDIYTYMKFSFNELNKERIFNWCEFYNKTLFMANNYFNSGIWNNCNFMDSLEISTKNQNNIGDIQFNNCSFNSDVKINIGNLVYIQFNNCTFAKTPSITNNRENVIYNNCVTL